MRKSDTGGLIGAASIALWVLTAFYALACPEPTIERCERGYEAPLPIPEELLNELPAPPTRELFKRGQCYCYVSEGEGW